MLIPNSYFIPPPPYPFGNHKFVFSAVVLSVVFEHTPSARTEAHIRL